MWTHTAPPPQSLQNARRRPCSQMVPPLHSLQVVRIYIYVCKYYTQTPTNTHTHTHTLSVCKSTLSCSQTWEPPQSRQRYFRRLCGHMYRELSHAFFGALPLTSAPADTGGSGRSSGGGGAPCRCVCAPGAGAKISGAFCAGGDEWPMPCGRERNGSPPAPVTCPCSLPTILLDVIFNRGAPRGQNQNATQANTHSSASPGVGRATLETDLARRWAAGPGHCIPVSAG